MGLLNVLGNSSKGIDAKTAEAKIRSDFPKLLGPNERIELAFKGSADASDKDFLTSHRILFKERIGFSSKRKKFKSIPYEAIKAFSVQTAGGGLDADTELSVWYDGGPGCVTINFVKNTVNLFEVQQYIGHKVFPKTVGAQLTTSSTTLKDYAASNGYVQQTTDVGSVMSWLGNDGVQVDPKTLESRFGSGGKSPVLLPGEDIEIAYQCWRDLVVITPTRFLLIDVKGLSGKRIEFFSMKWNCIKAFSVETAGKWDRDGDFVLHTSVKGCRTLRRDLRKGKTDMYQLNMAFANKLLGGGSPSDKIPRVSQYQGHVDPGASLIGGSNNRPLDVAEVEKVYRSAPCILQTDEYVEMAFKGRRDLVIFTTKRIIDINIQGFSGKRIEYTSFPYSSILSYAVQTAGKHDRDSEVIIFTEMQYNVPPEAEEPDPGMSMIEWDFNKNLVDVLNLKRYLNARLMGAERGIRVPTGLLSAAPKEQGVSNFLSYLGDDQRTIDAHELDLNLRTSLDVLMDGENVVMAFKSGRDISCFTNKRIFIIDKKGWSGKKVCYLSLPYSSVKAFSAESAGGWDRDSEVRIYTKNKWTLGCFRMDFRKGKADIVAIQKFLSAIVLGSERDASNYLKNITSANVKIDHPMSMNSFTDFLTDLSYEVDPRVIEAQLNSDPPTLLDDERVEKAYRSGRDLWVYTTLRILYVDVKGMSGKRVNYFSIPFNQKSVTAFEVETAGTIDYDAECYMYTSIPSRNRLMQKVLVSKGDIFDMHQYLGNRMLFDKKQPDASSTARTYAAAPSPSPAPATHAPAASSAPAYESAPSTYSTQASSAPAYGSAHAPAASSTPSTYASAPSTYAPAPSTYAPAASSAPAYGSSYAPAASSTPSTYASAPSTYAPAASSAPAYGSSYAPAASSAPLTYAPAASSAPAYGSSYAPAASSAPSTYAPATSSAPAYGSSYAPAASSAPSTYAPATSSAPGAAYVSSGPTPSGNMKPYV